MPEQQVESSPKKSSSYITVPIRPGYDDLLVHKSCPAPTPVQGGATDTEFSYDSYESDDTDDDETKPRLSGESPLPYRIRYSGKSSTRSLIHDTFAMKKEKQRSQELYAPLSSQIPEVVLAKYVKYHLLTCDSTSVKLIENWNPFCLFNSLRRISPKD